MAFLRGFFDDTATVLEVACETAYRSDNEQRALLRVAWKIDKERWLDTTTNPRRVAPYLEQMVDETRRLEDGDKQIPLPSVVHAKKRAKRPAQEMAA